MRSVLNRYNISPKLALVISTFVALSTLAISAMFELKQPWLGVELVVDRDQVRVEYVDPDGPSATVLYQNDIIVKIGGSEKKMIALQARDILEEANGLPTYQSYNEFLQRQGRLTTILAQPMVQILLDDGRVVRIQPDKKRPFFSLPWGFWLNHLIALMVLLISTGVWSVRKDMQATRLLLLSGLGLFLDATLSSIFMFRELALSPGLFHALAELNSIAIRIFCVCGIGLLWYYPRALARFPLFFVLVVVECVYMANHSFQWVQPPLHAFTFDLPLLAMVAVGVGVRRWRQSIHDPLDRAIVKWFLISIFPSITLVLVLDVMPIFVSSRSLMPVNGSYLMLLVVYCGLALGVVRYRLFDIDRWWLEIWLWFFAGAAIVAVDAALVMLTGLAPSYAVGISVLIAAWIYFPARQWLWGRFYPFRHGLEEYVPLLVRHFVRVEHANSQAMWKSVLTETFWPLSIEAREEEGDGVTIVDTGVRMLVPSLSGHGHLSLNYADKGGRLFNSEDARLAQALFNISKASITQRESYANGVLDERKRIMRDLHDDVGGSLLTLTHSPQEEVSATAVDALKSLREIIYSLDSEQEVTLNESVAKWRIEALERCEAREIAFNWKWNEVKEDITLSARYMLNLTLILREALSNVFKHSKTKDVVYCFTVTGSSLQVSLHNDEAISPEGEIKFGKGLQNMRFRTEELGGLFEYDCEGGSFDIHLTIPLIEEGTGA